MPSSRIALLWTLLLPGLGHADPTVPFTGLVREMGTRKPIAGAEIAVAGEGELTVVTDGEGRFSLPAVPVGARRVAVRAGGHRAAETEENFRQGRGLEVVYWLEPSERYRTVVRGAELQKETFEHRLEAEELRRIAGTGGDPLKAIQTLPGVARAAFGAGSLVVWGSAPEDTRAYVDGVAVPTLYHFAGLRATINPELVERVDFIPGGQGASFGRGLGGVVDLEARRPRTDGFHAIASLDPIDVSLLVEGPIGKRLSVTVAARRSLLDTFLPLVTPNSFQLTPVYYDYQLALRWKAGARDDVDVFLFGSDDALTLAARTPDPGAAAQVESHTLFARLLARWTHRFGGGATLTVTPAIGWDVPFQVKGSVAGVPLHVDARVFGYSTRAAARIPLGRLLRLDAGLDFEGTRTEIDASTPAAGAPREGDAGIGGGGLIADRVELHRIHGAPFATATFQLAGGRLTVAPGMRVEIDHFAGYLGTPDAFAHSYLLWEPRLSIRLAVERRVTLKAALGTYHQPPDPASFLRRLGNPDVRPQSATHYVGGVEVRPTQTLQIQASAFYKDLQALIVRAAPGSGERLDNGGTGRVYGMELLVRQRLTHHFQGWISYTLSRAERRDHTGGAYRPFDYDQTHILSVVGSYELPWGIQVGARFRYVTGSPTTPPAAWFYDANGDGYSAILGGTNSQRLAPFHQLDLRVDKSFVQRWFRWSVYLDVQNVYNQKNAERQQYAPRPEDGSEPIAGIPFFPSLGVRGEF